MTIEDGLEDAPDGMAVRRTAVAAFRLTLALGGLYILQFQTWPGQLSAVVFWAAAMWLFLLKTARGSFGQTVALVAALAAAAAAYAALNAYGDANRIAIFGPNAFEVAAGVAAIALTLYASWRCNGPPLALLAIAFLVFAFAGSSLPPGLGHVPIDLQMLVNHVFVTSEGLFGEPLRAVVQILVVFVMLSAFLERSGAADVINVLAYKAVGRSVGGPGKVAVVSSALFGTITGAAVANVIASGAFSIPMMRRAGYRPSQAAAIEAVASTGSQIAPPVLGSAAFIMAEFLGIPYTSIVLAVTLPAVIYFATLFYGVHAISALNRIDRLDMEAELPSVTLRDAILLLPLVILLVALVVFGFTPSYSGLLAVASIPFLTLLSSRGFMGLPAIASALQRTGELVMPLVMLTACAGIVIGVFTLTGFGFKMVNIITDLSGGRLFAVMVLAMLASIILGMGLPTVAVYIVLALTIAPVMVENGVPSLVAHIFVFYYGALAAITPPVALATIAAASIAEAGLWRSGFESVRLAIVAYVLPFMFVTFPGLLMQGGGAEVVEALFVVLPLSFSIVVASFGYLYGRLTVLSRVAFAVPALLIFSSNTILEIVAALLLLSALLAMSLGRRSFPQLIWVSTT